MAPSSGSDIDYILRWAFEDESNRRRTFPPNNSESTNSKQGEK